MEPLRLPSFSPYFSERTIPITSSKGQYRRSDHGGDGGAQRNQHRKQKKELPRSYHRQPHFLLQGNPSATFSYEPERRERRLQAGDRGGGAKNPPSLPGLPVVTRTTDSQKFNAVLRKEKNKQKQISANEKPAPSSSRVCWLETLFPSLFQRFFQSGVWKDTLQSTLFSGF